MSSFHTRTNYERQARLRPAAIKPIETSDFSFVSVMALRPIINLPDSRLRLVSKPVTTFDHQMLTLFDDMLETMYEAPGIGLAAIQLGIDQRMVTLDLAKRDDSPPQPLFLVNPEIIWSSTELSTYEEGCLSIPDFYEDVERPAKVRVRWQDRQGAVQEMEADGLLATALQHEIDHLNGVLFIDHISRLKRARVIRKFAKAARREGGREPDAR